MSISKFLKAAAIAVPTAAFATVAQAENAILTVDVGRKGGVDIEQIKIPFDACKQTAHISSIGNPRQNRSIDNRTATIICFPAKGDDQKNPVSYTCTSGACKNISKPRNG